MNTSIKQIRSIISKMTDEELNAVFNNEFAGRNTAGRNTIAMSDNEKNAESNNADSDRNLLLNTSQKRMLHFEFYRNNPMTMQAADYLDSFDNGSGERGDFLAKAIDYYLRKIEAEKVEKETDAQYLTASEFAKAVGITLNTLSVWNADGRVKPHHIETVTRYPFERKMYSKEQVEKCLKEQAQLQKEKSEYLTISGFAKATGVPSSTIKYWADTGRLVAHHITQPTKRYPRGVRMFSKEQAEEYLRSQKMEQKTESKKVEQTAEPTEDQIDYKVAFENLMLLLRSGEKVV